MKAFDSIEQGAVVNSLHEQGISEHITELLQSFFGNDIAVIDYVHKDTHKFNMENIFRKLKWQTKGGNTYDKFLNYLRFPDIIFVSETAEEL